MIRISSSHISGIVLVLSKKHGFTEEQQWHKILEVLKVKRSSSPPEKHKYKLDLLNSVIVVQKPKPLCMTSQDLKATLGHRT
jgi:siderophore synthetase component